MGRVITPTNRAVVRTIEAMGYRVCVGEHEGLWIATAKDDKAGQFHSVRAQSQNEVIAELASSAGIELADG